MIIHDNRNKHYKEIMKQMYWKIVKKCSARVRHFASVCRNYNTISNEGEEITKREISAGKIRKLWPGKSSYLLFFFLFFVLLFSFCIDSWPRELGAGGDRDGGGVV